MKLIYLTVTTAVLAATLAGCTDNATRRAAYLRAKAEREAAAAGETSGSSGGRSETSARNESGAAARTHPASCNLSRSEGASIPVLPENASRGTGEADYRTLGSDDEVLPSGERYDVMRINVQQAGQSLQVSVTSDDFTPRIILYDTRGCPWMDAVAADRNGVASIDERIDEAGVYQILITSTRPGATGAYNGTLNIVTETPL